jgi:hypothetical protein
VQDIAQYLREETYFHYPHSDILIRWKYTYNLASIHICCKTNCSRVMFKCAGPKAATWGQDGGWKHRTARGDHLTTTTDFGGFVFPPLFNVNMTPETSFNIARDICSTLKFHGVPQHWSFRCFQWLCQTVSCLNGQDTMMDVETSKDIQET